MEDPPQKKAEIAEIAEIVEKLRFLKGKLWSGLRKISVSLTEVQTKQKKNPSRKYNFTCSWSFFKKKMIKLDVQSTNCGF